MSLLEDLTEDLARDVFAAELKVGSAGIADEIGRALADSSSIMEEAFLTNMRYLRADHRARQMLTRRAKQGLA